MYKRQSGAQSFVTEIQTQATEIVVVQAAPHPDGAFLAWLEVEPDGQLALYAARVVMASATIVGPTLLTKLSGGAAFAIASVDRRLFLARQDTSSVIVSALDESLQTAAETTVNESASPTAALPSPDGKSVIVAWRRAEGMPTRVEVARFDCAP